MIPDTGDSDETTAIQAEEATTKICRNVSKNQRFQGAEQPEEGQKCSTEDRRRGNVSTDGTDGNRTERTLTEINSTATPEFR